jgi:hypothetical protein
MVWCVISVIVSLTVIADSFLPGAPHLPALTWVVPFVGNFPASLVVVFRVVTVEKDESLRQRQQGLVDFVLSLPFAGRVAVIVALGVAVASFAIFRHLTPQGVPDVSQGGYQITDHGQVTPVTEQEYRRDLAASYRAAASGAAFFATATGVSALGLHRRRASA